MVVNLPITERLNHYFLAMGAQISQDHTDQTALCFLVGSDRIQVHILTPEDLIQKNRLIDTLMQLSSLRSESQLYIAAPRLLGATLDNRILNSYGIGLLLYDDRRIEETVKSVPVPARIQTQSTVNVQPDLQLLSELTSLKSMYTQIQKSLEDVRNEFDSFRKTQVSATKPQSDIELPTFNVNQQPYTQTFCDAVTEISLPSFFSNNPWLDLLSKRGKAEVVPIAG